jgi:hypothetical protein
MKFGMGNRIKHIPHYSPVKELLEKSCTITDAANYNSFRHNTGFHPEPFCIIKKYATSKSIIEVSAIVLNKLFFFDRIAK